MGLATRSKGSAFGLDTWGVAALATVALLFASACTGEEEVANYSDVTKLEARQQNGRANDGTDYCQVNGWYGDAACDPFCPLTDEDCAGVADPCADLGWYGDGTCDTYCRTPDPDCGSSGACGGALDVVCPQGQYCALDEGQACGGSGTCQEMPEMCTEEYAPVCGCDGNTYSNDCGAAAAGANVDYVGECQTGGACGGVLDVACPEGQYCALSSGETCGGAGTCVARPDVCTADESPVCGCDGETYGNACGAAAAGQNVASVGACDVLACGGRSGGTCAAGEVCIFPPLTCGAADEAGACQARPEACPELYSPVCGCDGNTYGNECEATAAGASVQHPGECGASAGCGGLAGLGCPTGQVCIFPESTCNWADMMGECVDAPEVCPDVWMPVCGCDGRTYGNRCDAVAAGASIDHEGPCDAGSLCGGFAGAACAAGEVCLFRDGTCDLADNTGACQQAPEVCADEFAPVCGCDGQTYGNRCEATTAGMSVDYEGACGSGDMCGGIADVRCGTDEVCVFAEGICGMMDPVGRCQPAPAGCPDVWMPVCGCDGTTWSSRCDAVAAGAIIAYEGACADPSRGCGGLGGQMCASSEVCIYDDGTCSVADNVGACQSVPQVCPNLFAPVCGCDGNTYGNRCEATAAGASIDYVGECRAAGTSCGGLGGNQCASGEVCIFPDGTCGAMNPLGACELQPSMCGMIYDPVCGCDGQTYGNRCTATGVGVSIAHLGPC